MFINIIPIITRSISYVYVLFDKSSLRKMMISIDDVDAYLHLKEEDYLCPDGASQQSQRRPCHNL